MRERRSRRSYAAAILLFTCCWLGLARVGSAEPDLESRLRAMLRQGALKGAVVGVLVVELDAGEVVLEHASQKLLLPASLVKLFTMATALKLLSPQYTWKTELLGEGLQEGGVWRGTLYIRGQGDPAFVSERLWLVAEELKKLRLERVEGGVVVDDSYFDAERHGRGWAPLTRAWYHAPIGALSFNHNAFEHRGRYRAIQIDPAVNTGRALIDTLDEVGIQVKGELRRGETPVEARRLLVSRSRQLGAIAADVHKFSNNFMAEQILRTLGAEVHGSPGTADKGLEVVRSFLATRGFEPDSYRLEDGSGLSKLNRLSAAQVVRLLVAMAGDFEVGPEFRASLKVAGAEGKDERFKDPLCLRRMRVKTGHLNGVNALAGYARDASGRDLAFAVIANGLRSSRGAADQAVERLCELFLARRAARATGSGPAGRASSGGDAGGR